MIYTFETKRSSNKFIHGFVKNFESKNFTYVTGPGEQFYNISWPSWNETLENGVEIAFQGIIRNTHKLVEACKENNNDYYYFDQPYFFGTNYANHHIFNDVWYRIIKNDVQQCTTDTNLKHMVRFKEIYNRCNDGIVLEDWRTKGDHILVIPPSHHTARWYHINETEWVDNIVKEIRKHTDREIRVRYKYVNGMTFGEKNKTPLKEDFKNCWAIVSWHSMCASEAVVKGIPSFSSIHSPAAPVSLKLNELNKIENPVMPKREQWLYSLLGSQFTLQEMQSGYAYRYINEF